MWQDIRILILEDDRELLRALFEVLEDAGFQARPAASSEEALQHALEEDFDVVVTDIRMAGVDGLEALAGMQKLLPEVRSLVITGFSSECDTIRALRLGVGEYLQKPFSLDDFTEAVRRLALQARELRTERTRERSMRRYLLWSLKNWAQQRPQASTAWLNQALQWCARLAQGLGFETGGVEALQVACLCEALASELPEEVEVLLPPGVRAILRSPEGLEREILAVAGALARSEELPPRCPPALRLIAAAEATISGEATSAPPLAGGAQQRRAALSLAWQWEQQGQYAAAHRAYSQLQSATGREGWLASLGLARLARTLNHPEPLTEHALKALEQARQLGPLSLAAASLEAGLLLAGSGRQIPTASKLLQDSQTLNESLGFEARASLARAGQAWLSGLPLPCESLQRLSGEELRSASWWLIPGLKADGSPAAVALLQRLLPQAERCSPPTLRILSLGTLEVYLGSERADEEAFRKNQKARLLLVFLACERGRFRSDEILAEIFWPQEGARGRKNLYSLRSILRKALAGAGEEADYVQRTSLGLCLNPDMPWSHDWEDLHDHLRSGSQAESQGDVSQALHHLRQAVQLYRGPFLESCYMDWALELRQNTELKVMEGLHQLARLTLQQARRDECREVCQRLLDLDPLHQQAYALWMQSLLEDERPQEVLRIFERARRTLSKELGCEPELALLELYQRARMKL